MRMVDVGEMVEKYAPGGAVHDELVGHQEESSGAFRAEIEVDGSEQCALAKAETSLGGGCDRFDLVLNAVIRGATEVDDTKQIVVTGLAVLLAPLACLAMEV